MLYNLRRRLHEVVALNEMKSILVEKGVPSLFALAGCLAIGLWVRGNSLGPKIEPRPLGTEAPASTLKSNKSDEASSPSGPSVGTSPAVAVAVPELPGEWPAFRGAKHDGISTESVALATDFSKLQLLWSVEMGEGYAAAAVKNSRVYVLDYDEAKQADVLRCLALADGKEVWRRGYPVSVKRYHGMSRTIPAVDGGLVVTIGPKCHVMVCDALTGAEKWRVDMVKEYGTKVPEWYAGQCPLIDNGKLILAPAGSSLMVALDLKTGKPIWKTPNPRNWTMTHASIAPMEIGGQRTYVYPGSGGVVGVSAKDGKILWDTTEWVVSTATVPTPVDCGNGRIFLCGGYNAGAMMLQIEGSTAKTLFRLKSQDFGSDQQTPVFYKGNIYGARPNGEMVCLGLDGKTVWTSGRNLKFGLGPYMIAGGLLYAMNDNGLLTLAQAKPDGFAPLAQAQVLSGRESWGPLALAGGRLIARDSTRMVCLDVSKR